MAAIGPFSTQVELSDVWGMIYIINYYFTNSQNEKI